MSKRSSLLFAPLFGVLALTPALARAQTAPQRGRALVTVVDPMGGYIPDATVTLVGLEPATKAAAIPPAKTDAKGVATFDRLVLGRYSIQGDFPGFQMGLLRDIRLRAGDNRHVVVLPLKQMSESVTVTQDQREAASQRPALGTALTREQIDALSDDPDELQRQISELAGPNATIRVDSFEGSQLPPKAQIKSIHITRDQYAAEQHYIGGLFIDIVTQPGIGPLRGNANFGYSGSQLNGRTAFTPVKGPEQNRNFGFGMGGTIARNKADFSLNMNGMSSYSTPSVYVYGPEGRRAETLDVRTPRRQASVQGTLNYAVTKDQTIRVSGFVGGNGQDNLGISGNNLADRGYSSRARNRMFNFQEVGPIGRRFFLNTRGNFRYSTTETHSLTETPTIVINDAQTTGGAQRRGGSTSKSLNVQSDLDYIRGINSWRVGLQFEGTWYQADDDVNYLGTYTFTSVDEFLAGRPLFFTKRIGDPNIAYSNLQAGFYIQDDIRISKTLTLSPGLRYEAQTHVTDYNGFAPRFGATWSPFKSGKTTIRGGGGIFYEWLGVGTFAQTVRVDGLHQRDLTITNPSYPDPGNVGSVRATNKYLLASDYVMPRNVGVNIGIDQALTKRIRISAGYTFSKASQVARGRNLNAPVNGVRPDPQFLNVIETVSDAASRDHDFYVSSGFSLTPPGPAGQQARFNWKRLSFNGYFSSGRYMNNSDGAFTVPASGNLDTEWGPVAGRSRNFVSFSINSTMVRNLNVNIGFNSSSGAPYNITTGLDDNGDLMFNDRPAGYARNSGWVPVSYVGLRAGLGYTFTFGPSRTSAQPGIQISGDRGGLVVNTVAAAAAKRYRMSINVSANNLTNRNNFGGYVGNMKSGLFGQPTSSGAPRSIQISTSFGF